MLRAAVLASAVALAVVHPARGREAEAQGAVPLVSVEPRPIETAQQIVDVDVVIENGEGVAGFQFVLIFDGQRLEFLDITEGEFLKETGRDSLCSIPERDGDAVRFACASIGLLPEPTESAGRLAAAQFRIKGAGTSAIALRRLRLDDVLGEELVSEAADATVRLDGGPSGAGVARRWWWLGAASGGAFFAAAALYRVRSIRRARGATAGRVGRPSN